MQTSNKILLAFLLLLFIVPVSAMLALKKKIARNEYTLVRNDRVEAPMQLLPGNFKVIHITSVDSQNNCRLIACKPGNISFHETDAKYIRSVIRLDTLFITYGRENNDHIMTIGVPELTNILIDKTNVLLEDLNHFSVPDIHVALTNQASIRIDDGSEAAYRNMNFIVDNSRLELIKASPINQLMIQTTGNSSVEIGEQVQSQVIDAQFSPTTHVNANWNFVQRIRLK